MKTTTFDLLNHFFLIPININRKRKVTYKPNKSDFNLFFLFWKYKAGKFLKSLKSLDLISPFFLKKYLFIITTKNQFLALEPLIEKCQESSSILVNQKYFNTDLKEKIKFPFTLVYALDIIIFPYFFLLIKPKIKNKEYLNDFTLFESGSVVLSAYLIFKYLFKIKKPEFLITANDHSDFNVSLIYAATVNKIKTVYFQHANISKIFPPLVFDFAMLNSIESAKIYREIGTTKTKILCVGNMKVDKHLRENMKKSFNPNKLKIGISVNSYSELDENIDLANFLFHQNNIDQIIFRLHPVLNKKEIKFNSQKIKISDFKNESSFEFLNRIDLNIVGNSSIIEEGLFTNTPSIYFSPDKSMYDYYGYVKNNVVLSICNSKEEVLNSICKYEKPIDVFKKAYLYSSSINSKYKGKTVDLVDKILKEIEENKFSETNLFIMEEDDIFQINNYVNK